MTTARGHRHVRRERRRSIPVVVGLAALGLAGCGAAGPAGLIDGDYRYLTGSRPLDGPGAATLRIDDGTLTFRAGSTRVTARLGTEADEAVLCPGGGTGRPVRLDAPVEIGGLTIGSPAVFGDCGATTPRRVTLVDLDAPVDALPPYGRWVEFCLAADRDCPA